MRQRKEIQTSSRPEFWCDWLARFGLLSLIAYAPWPYAMATWRQGQLLIWWVSAILLTTLLAISVRSTTRFRLNPLALSLLAIAALAFVQTLSIPATLHQWIAPANVFQAQAEQVSASCSSVITEEPSDGVSQTSKEALGPFAKTLSIYPDATQASLGLLLAGLAIFFCASVLFQDKASRSALLIVVVITVTSSAILGIYQNVSWNQWTLLKMPHSANFSTFVNRNSAPQFLAMGLGATIALMAIQKRKREKLREKRYQRRYPATGILGKLRQAMEDLLLELDTVMVLLLFALITTVVAIFAAASRGGVVGFLLATAITTLFYIASNRRWIVTGLAGFAVVSFASIFFLGLLDLDQEISDRMQNLESQGRLDLWASWLKQPQYWLFGSGLGTYQIAIMPVNPMQNLWPRHAESIYMESATEFGLLGLFIILAGLLWSFMKLLPRESSRTIQLWPAALFSLVAIGFQSAVDFGLILPAIFVPMAAIWGGFLGELKNLERPTSTSSAKRNFILLGVVLLMGMLFCYRSLLGYSQAESVRGFSLVHRTESAESLREQEGRGEAEAFLPENLEFSHPEVVLELARWRLKKLERDIRALPDWPSSLPLKEQIQLSSPEFVSAVLRSSSEDPQWKAWKQFYRNHPFVAKDLHIAHQAFEFASRRCPMDWRSVWGLFRTQTTPMTRESLENWGKLHLLSSSLFDIQEVTGTCCLIAGERCPGLLSWKAALANKAAASTGLAALLGRLISDEELQQLLPDNPYSLGLLAKSLETARPEASAGLLKSIDLQQLTSISSTVQQWELVFWVSDRNADAATKMLALRKIADLQPFDVGIRVRLAKQFEADDKLREAVEVLEQAGRRASLSDEVQKYLQKLRRQIEDSLPPK